MREELKTRSPRGTTTAKTLPIPVLSWLFIRLLLIFCVRIKSNTKKKHILNDDWRANEALKKKKVQHNNNIVEWKRSKDCLCTCINHFIFAMIIIIIIAAMFMRCKGRMKNRESIVKELISVSSYFLRTFALRWHVINMSTCITIHPSEWLHCLHPARWWDAFFLGFSVALLLLPFSAWRETI